MLELEVEVKYDKDKHLKQIEEKILKENEEDLKLLENKAMINLEN